MKNLQSVLSAVDHTQLSVSAGWKEIKEALDEGMHFHTASVCIPPSYVKQASDYVKGKIKICTVIGFPTGYSTTETKVFETYNAIGNGADEIDMVLNVGKLKSGDYDGVREEIDRVKEACQGKILKVIIETCLLTEKEKIASCKVVTDSCADYIKTSTGFSAGGATFEDVALLKKHVGEDVKVKASGGIRSVEDAETFLALGASRLGTSKIVAIAKASEEVGR